jgi:prepilin-type N-terminal cleavage/methylation domain-containing protein
MRKYFNNYSSDGFTLLEMLVVVLTIAILSAIALPSWLSFVNVRRLNTAQDQVYLAIREAQRQATKEKLTWQVSFREQNTIIQWAVHPATLNTANANWNNLDSNVRFDKETTLQQSNGIRQLGFDYRGHPNKLIRITLYSKSGGQAKRCVYVSTLLGTMRTAKEQATAKNGDYCY